MPWGAAQGGVKGKQHRAAHARCVGVRASAMAGAGRHHAQQAASVLSKRRLASCSADAHLKYNERHMQSASKLSLASTRRDLLTKLSADRQPAAALCSEASRWGCA